MDLRVGLAVYYLVGGEVSTTSENRTEQGLQEDQIIWGTLYPKVESSCRSDQDHQYDPRFGQFKEIKSTATRAFDRHVEENISIRVWGHNEACGESTCGCRT